jgi:protein-disulfide isomerase
MQGNTPIALAIVVGFGLVAMAIYASGTPATVAGTPEKQQPETPKDLESPLRTENRNLYGDPGAATTIVEFSDFECPFCSRVHPTIKRLVDESNGTINWEYRHLPLPMHRNAELAAVMSECVARSQGNDAFWSFSDTVFENQRSINADFMTTAATALGITESDLNTCIADPAIMERVTSDVAVARAYGGSGTPFSLIVTSDGSVTPVSGALPYERWLPLIN